MGMVEAGIGLSAMSSIGQGLMGRGQDKVAQAQARLSAASRNNDAAYQEYNQLQDITAYNASAMEANQKNAIRANVRGALLELQRANEAKRSAQERFIIGSQREDVLGSLNANAAAAGTVGASITAVAADADRAMDQALAKNQEDWDVTARNFMTASQDLAWSMEDSFISGKAASSVRQARQEPTILPPVRSVGSIVAGAAIGAGAQYFTAMAKLDLGKPKA